MGRVPGVVALDLQQFDLATGGGKFGLLGGIGLAQVTDFVTAGVELGVQPIVCHVGRAQALFEQCQLSLRGSGPTLQVPGQRQQRHCCARQA